MAGPAPSTSDAGTPSKRRRTSQKQTENALDALIAHTIQSDLEYIVKELHGSLADVAPTLASWVRDGRLQKALVRQRSQADPTWASTCRHIKQVGVTRCMEMLQTFESNFFDGMAFVGADASDDLALDDDERGSAEKIHRELVTSRNLVKFVAFALGCSVEAWLPSAEIKPF